MAKDIEKAGASKVALADGMDLEALKEDAGVGTQMGVQDVALPYLYILQALSPQCQEGNSAYDPEAKPGMFFNHVTGEIFEGKKQGLMIVPCAYERRLVEWVHRDEGGGWVADHSVDSDIMSKTKPDSQGRPRLMNGDKFGNVIVETAYQYGLFFHPETEVWGQCCIPMKSTGLKKNRAWNNMIVESMIPGTQVKAPRFLFPYQVRTVLETKANNSWHNFDIEQLPRTVSPEVYKAAKNFHEMVSQGVIRRAVENDGTETPMTVEVQGVDKVDDEIPF